MSQLRSPRTPAQPSTGTSAYAAGYDVRTPAGQAYRLLRTVFTIAPIAFGLDKFAGLLADWEGYLAPWVDDLVPGTAHDAMLAVGVIEIIAGNQLRILRDERIVRAIVANPSTRVATRDSLLDFCVRSGLQLMDLPEYV